MLFQHVSASYFGVLLFNFACKLFSTALLSLTELSSAAKFYLDSGIHFALLYIVCIVCDGDDINYVVTVEE